MSQPTEFTLTEDHIKLVRHFYVGWQDGEDERGGGPAVCPKRPYGNSSVQTDIHEILTGETIGEDASVRDELTDEEYEKYVAMHKETEVALQIILVTGSFKPGIYRRTRPYGDRSWVQV